MNTLAEDQTPPAGRTLLFVYGQLQPGMRPPRSMSVAWPDSVRGRLFDLGEYPAAVSVGRADTWIEGYVLEISERELSGELDRFEGVDRGLYRRVRATTRAGHAVWVYEYARELPRRARGPIERWPPHQLPGPQRSGKT